MLRFNGASGVSNKFKDFCVVRISSSDRLNCVCSYWPVAICD